MRTGAALLLLTYAVTVAQAHAVIAAQRAAAADDGVRAAMVCPATAPMASPFSATGAQCPRFFATRCPAPGSKFPRQLINYGFAPDAERSTKHRSHADHGSKPECPGLVG